MFVSFSFPAKKRVKCNGRWEKGQRRGYGNRSIPQSAHQVLNERGETRQSEVSRAKSI